MVPERAVRDGATAIADWDNAHDCVDVVLGRTFVGQENHCQMGGEDLYLVLCWAANIYD